MEPSRTNARRAGLLALVIAVSLVASACSSGPAQRAALASVGETRITQDDLNREIAIEKAFTRAVGKSQNATPAQMKVGLGRFDGTGTDTLATAELASPMTNLVQTAMLEEALRRNDGKVTEEQRADAKTAVEENYKSQGVDVKSLPAAYVTQVIESQALRTAISTSVKVTDAQLKAAYNAQALDYANICVSLIYVDDEKVADAAFDRVTVDGDDFGAVSAEVSTEPTIKAANGVAGCGATADVAASLGQGVYKADLNEVQQPVEVQGGWVVVKVTERTVPKLSEIKDQLLPSLQGKGVQKIIDKVVGDVTVDPRVGTWNPKTYEVEAPVVPAIPGASTTTSVPTLTGG